MYCKVSLPGYFLTPPPERVIWGPLSAIPMRDSGSDIPNMAKRCFVFHISPRDRTCKEPEVMLCGHGVSVNRLQKDLMKAVGQV